MCCAGILLVTLSSSLFPSPLCSLPCKAACWWPHGCPLASSFWPEIGKRGRRECGLGIYAPGHLSVQLPAASYGPWGRPLLHSDALLFERPLCFSPESLLQDSLPSPSCPQGWRQLCCTCACPACAFVNSSSINPCVFSPCEHAKHAPDWYLCMI